MYPLYANWIPTFYGLDSGILELIDAALAYEFPESVPHTAKNQLSQQGKVLSRNIPHKLLGGKDSVELHIYSSGLFVLIGAEIADGAALDPYISFIPVAQDLYDFSVLGKTSNFD